MSRSRNNSRPVSKVRKSLIEKYLSREKLIPAAIVLSLILFACAHVWKQVHFLDVSVEVRALEIENETLCDLLKKREAEITEMTRLSVIETLASEKINLKKTATENLFTLIRDESFRETDGIESLVLALKKVADNLPVITETRAENKDVFKFDEE